MCGAPRLPDDAEVLSLLFLVCALDAFFPLVPSETMVIGVSVVATHGEMAVWTIPVVAALGSFVGDHVSFGAGRMLEQRGRDRWFRSRRGRARLAWAARMLEQRG